MSACQRLAWHKELRLEPFQMQRGLTSREHPLTVDRIDPRVRTFERLVEVVELAGGPAQVEHDDEGRSCADGVRMGL